MTWDVDFHPAFDPEFDALSSEVQDELLAQAKLLEAFGPMLGRPRADTLKGSRHANMKELRFTAAGGVWRVAFAFDPERKAIVLVAGDKSGVGGRALRSAPRTAGEVHEAVPRDRFVFGSTALAYLGSRFPTATMGDFQYREIFFRLWIDQELKAEMGN